MTKFKFGDVIKQTERYAQSVSTLTNVPLRRCMFIFATNQRMEAVWLQDGEGTEAERDNMTWGGTWIDDWELVDG